MGQLTNQYVSSSYQGLLKMTDSTTGVTNTLQTVQTGDGTNTPLQISKTEVSISGSLYQTGTFYADQIDVSRGGIVNGTGSYVATFNNDGLLQYATYPEIVVALGQYASSGTSGTSGSSGSNGSSGTSGSNGSSGTSGNNGSSGTSGSNGSSGTSGGTGSSGTSGTSGSNGSSGTSGQSGSSGTSGSSGSNGSSGTSGSNGSSGTSGQNGSSGTSGSSGSNGSDGSSGTSGVSPSVVGFITTGSAALVQSITGSITISEGLYSTGSLTEVGNIYLFNPAFNSSSVKLNITGSNAVSQSNFIFGSASGSVGTQTGSIVISGSNNILLTGVRTANVGQGFVGYVNGSNNILGVIPQYSTSSVTPIMTNNNILFSTPQFDITSGSISGNRFTFNNNVAIGAGSNLTFRHKSGSLAANANFFLGTVNSFASRSFFDINSSPQLLSNLINGSPTTLLNTSSSITMQRNSTNANTLLIDNQFTNPSSYSNGGSGSLTVNNNLIAGNTHTFLSSGSNATDRNINNNLIIGYGNTLNQISSGSDNTNLTNTAVLGQGLIVSGSNTSATTTGGSTFVGRWNATGSLQEATNETIFVVGTGTAANARRNALHIDSSNNIRMTGSILVSGSLSVTGGINYLSGSNTTVGIVALDGGNPGTVTVSNSLVTANSLIFLTKQTLTNAHSVAVSSKGSSTFTITSTGNGDSDTVAYQIINPA